MVIYDRKFFDPIPRRSSFCLLRETNTVVVHACVCVSVCGCLVFTSESAGCIYGRVQDYCALETEERLSLH